MNIKLQLGNSTFTWYDMKIQAEVHRHVDVIPSLEMAKSYGLSQLWNIFFKDSFEFHSKKLNLIFLQVYLMCQFSTEVLDVQLKCYQCQQ